MSNYGTLLFNKIIENDDVSVLKRLGLNADNFSSPTDRATFEFIDNYAAQNGGHAPSLEVVMTEIDSFIATRGVEDSYDYLTRKIMNETAKNDFSDVYNRIADEFSEGQRDMTDFLQSLTAELDAIKLRTDVREKVGTSVKLGVKDAIAEYQKRKTGESAQRWKSKYSIIDEYVGGNVYVPYGKSGRGKSVITLDECVHMALQGAIVLVWSMEMPTFEVLSRVYAYLSAGEETSEHFIGGRKILGGFDAGKIKKGTLSGAEEAKFIEYATGLLATLPGDIIIRGVDDDDFGDRSLRALESDILKTGANVVMIDPFYYLDYEPNVSRKTGGDAEETSKKLRRLTGRHRVVTFAITQAEESDSEIGGEDREVVLPKRSEVKKTKQLLEDAALLIAIDTNYHRELGEVGINKGRDGGEGLSEEIMYLPQIGIVKTLKSAISVNDFGF